MTSEDVKRLCWIFFSEGRLGLKTTIEDDQLAFKNLWEANAEWWLTHLPVHPQVNYNTPCKGDDIIKK